MIRIVKGGFFPIIVHEEFLGQTKALNEPFFKEVSPLELIAGL